MNGARFAQLLLLVVLAVGGSLSGNARDANEEPDEETAEESFEFPPEIEKLLTESSDPESYAAEERCVQTRRIRGTEVLDDQHIVFRMSGDTFYLVRFKHRCMRLTRHSTLIYDTHGNNLCRLDAIRASDTTGYVGPPCPVPGFVEITGEQVTLLRDTLKAQRQRKG